MSSHTLATLQLLPSTLPTHHCLEAIQLQLHQFCFCCFFLFLIFVTAPAKTQSFAILLCSHPESSGQKAVLRSFGLQCRLFSHCLFSVSRLFVSLLSVSSFCLFSLTLLCVSSLSLSLCFFSSIRLGDGAKSQEYLILFLVTYITFWAALN